MREANYGCPQFTLRRILTICGDTTTGTPTQSPSNRLQAGRTRQEAIRNGTAERIRAGEKISKEMKVVIYESGNDVNKIKPIGVVIKR
jgi:hypothetical protein